MSDSRRYALRATGGPSSGHYFDGMEFNERWVGGRPRWVARREAAYSLTRKSAARYIQMLAAEHAVRPELRAGGLFDEAAAEAAVAEVGADAL